MKVLYVGYYRETGIWGEVAKNNILALEKAGCDVVCRCIDFGTGGDTPRELKRFEEKDLRDVEYCIQHVFPDHIVGSQKFKKNVAIFWNDHVEYKHSTWAEKLGLVDEVWFPKEVYPAMDVRALSNNYSGLSIPSLDNTFKIYSIVDSGPLPSIVRAFHSEFDIVEPVNLILQIDSFDRNPELTNALAQKVDEIKATLGFPTKQDFISGYWDTQLSKYQLHEYGNCYVSNNKTGFDLYDVEAVAFGSNPIVAEQTVAASLLPCVNVPGVYMRKKQAEKDLFRDMNNAHDFTIQPCEKAISEKMREAYNEWKKDPMKSVKDRKDGLEAVSKFSLENVGNKMKELLNA